MTPALYPNLASPMDSAPSHQISSTQPHEHLRKWTRERSLTGSPLHLASGNFVEGNHYFTSKGRISLASANQMKIRPIWCYRLIKNKPYPKSRYYHGMLDSQVRIYDVGMKKRGFNVVSFLCSSLTDILLTVSLDKLF